MQHCLTREPPGAEIRALRQIFIFEKSNRPLLLSDSKPPPPRPKGDEGERRPRHQNCTLTTLAPKKPCGFTAPAATPGTDGRLKETKGGEGPSVGTQMSETLRGRPAQEAEGVASLPPHSDSPATPHSRRAPQPAPGLASFQLGQIRSK